MDWDPQIGVAASVGDHPGAGVAEYLKIEVAVHQAVVLGEGVVDSSLLTLVVVEGCEKHLAYSWTVVVGWLWLVLCSPLVSLD